MRPPPNPYSVSVDASVDESDFVDFLVTRFLDVPPVPEAPPARRPPETAVEFAERVKARAGRAPYAIPRLRTRGAGVYLGDEGGVFVIGGATIAKSPHGRLIFFDFVGSGPDGVDTFARCAIVDPSPAFEDLFPAAPGVTVENDAAGVLDLGVAT